MKVRSKGREPTKEMAVTDEQLMQPVSDYLARARSYDTFDLPHLARLMQVPEQRMREWGEQCSALMDPSWPGQGWVWEVDQFRTWYWGGGMSMLATWARLHG